MALTDLACVIHAHSTHSDGTGTVAEIAAQAGEAGVDAVLLTDHDTLAARRAGDERYHGRVLVCAGVEVSPREGNHYLAFGIADEVDHRGLGPEEIVAAVAAAGGFGFLAHPFSEGSRRFRRAGPPMPWSDLEIDGYTGLELWSLVTDAVEAAASLRELAHFIARPATAVTGPPARNVAGWDRLLARRRVVAIGGVDAHQVGLRIGGRVPFRLMAYRRSFAHLRTHVLREGPPTGDAAADRAAVYAALRAGRCYLAMDSLAPARGFTFDADGRAPVEMGAEDEWREGARLTVRVPVPAELTLLRDGAPVARAAGRELAHPAEGPGVYRAEARLRAHGAPRTWILSNPVYLRAA